MRCRGFGAMPWHLPLWYCCFILPCQHAAAQGQEQSPAQAEAGQLLEQMMALLSQQDSQGLPRIIHFNEFSWLQDLECPDRLLHVWNSTVQLREDIENIYNDAITGYLLYIKVLNVAPGDNSWIWMIGNAHNKVTEHMHTYFSKLLIVALDHHLCFMTDVKAVVLEMIISWKSLYSDLIALQWNGYAYSGYTNATARGPQDVVESLYHGNLWVERTRDWFDGFAQRLSATMTKELPGHEFQRIGMATRLHHQDQHGAFVPYEYMRRKAFGQWALDKGLLRALIRHVWQPPLDAEPPFAIGDFGAGGGQYSSWLNETGLLQAFAFDGTPLAATVSEGAVQEVSLVDEFRLWRTFDWVLCLEVGEHIPAQFAEVLVANIKRHAKKGIVMSWSDDWEGIGHVNCMSKGDFIDFITRATGFQLDAAVTDRVAAECEIDYIGRTVAVFRAPAGVS